MLFEELYSLDPNFREQVRKMREAEELGDEELADELKSAVNCSHRKACESETDYEDFGCLFDE
jgi:ribosome-binding protein aMBF1 (putative translation factor)